MRTLHFHCLGQPTMAPPATAIITVFLLLTMFITNISCQDELAVLQMAKDHVLQAKNWIMDSAALSYTSEHSADSAGVALSDCSKLYDESNETLAHMLAENSAYTGHDARTWLSAVLTNHRTCLEGLEQKAYANVRPLGHRLSKVLDQALAVYQKSKGKGQVQKSGFSNPNEGLLGSWNPSNSKAYLTVAQDGSGRHKTIKEALSALSAMGQNRPHKAIIYVKAGVYNEKVVIERSMKNVMLIGDGMDRTIITGRRNRIDGATTLSSATFDVSGDGFWARDITVENTAGPQKEQAVALRVGSDLSVFYRCSFKAYQDTLYVHSNRQFFRDCHIYGTIDFIFGNSAVVLQNCDIFVRNPMAKQSNFITAQGRASSNENTGITIQQSRVRPAADFVSASRHVKSYLGRPWRQYSRTVFVKTDLDGLIDPRGWSEWNGNFALSTLYYGEYSNTGIGASTGNRVTWRGFHVLRNSAEASPFTVSKFIQGDSWVPAAGVPFQAGI